MPKHATGPMVQHHRVREILLEKIATGEFVPGEKIPSERKLCEMFSVSRTTIRRAIDELAAEGVLVRIPAKGTYVAESSLANTQNTGNIGFIRCFRRSPLSSINDDVFYPRILAGVEAVISKNGYHCLVQSVNENDFTEQTVAQLTQKVDGLICCELRSQRFLDTLRASRLPIVLVSPSLTPSSVDMVEISNREGAVTAVNHLIEHGHRRIAFVGGSPNSRPSKVREAGYIQALRDNGLPVRSEYLSSNGWKRTDGCAAMEEILKCDPRPTAVFAASDLLALGAYDAVEKAGLRIPEDISIIGFDNIDMAAEARPALSTIHVRKLEMGQVAARLILEQLTGQRDYPLRVVVPTVIVPRGSVGAVGEKVERQLQRAASSRR